MTDKINKAIGMLLSMQRHSWEQGVAMQAMLETGQYELLVQMAYEAVNRSLPDGRLAVIGVTDGATDSCAVGEGLLRACRINDSRYLKEGYDKLVCWTLDRAPRDGQGLLYHLTTGKQFWADSIYMLPPFLAAAGYYKEALNAVYGYWDKLYDREARLINHMWDERGYDTPDAYDMSHWGSGNGWVLSGIGRVIAMLPKEEYEKDIHRLIQMELELLDSILRYAREDGLFHNILDDTESFVETNMSQMTAYTIYRGVLDGWMPSDYLPWAEKLRNAADKKVNEVGLVQDVCGAPTFDKPGYAPEGQAFYIMMEQARNNCKEDYLI
jgi:rhamnogalacturonyl hydrolase YesR